MLVRDHSGRGIEDEEESLIFNEIEKRNLLLCSQSNLTKNPSNYFSIISKKYIDVSYFKLDFVVKCKELLFIDYSFHNLFLKFYTKKCEVSIVFYKETCQRYHYQKCMPLFDLPILCFFYCS